MPASSIYGCWCTQSFHTPAHTPILHSSACRNLPVKNIPLVLSKLTWLVNRHSLCLREMLSRRYKLKPIGFNVYKHCSRIWLMSYWQDKVIIMLDRHRALLAASFKLLSRRLLLKWMRMHGLGTFKGIFLGPQMQCCREQFWRFEEI